MITTAQARAQRRAHMMREVVARRTRVTITTRTPAGWRMTSGVFQSLDADALVWVRLNETRDGSAPVEFATEQDVGLTFRRGHKKCLCHTIVRAVTHRDGSPALGLVLPEQIQELQRRVFERTMVPPGRTIQIEVRPLQGQAGGAASGTLDDVSAGGVRVRVGVIEPLQLGATYQCRFLPSPGCEGLTLDAVLRHAEAPVNGRASLGFQFIGLEASAAGYEQLLDLARFVKSLQRMSPHHAPPGARPQVRPSE